MSPRTSDTVGRPAEEAAPPPLSLSVAATQENAARARRELQGWLITIGWPLDRRADIVLAVSEALSNVVDHAYRGGHAPGPVHLSARQELDLERDRRHVVASVGDEGHWTEPTGGATRRGRGLPMIHRCMADVRIEQGDAGTRVEMDSTAVPVDRHGRTRR